VYISKRSDMDNTVLPANTPCLPFLLASDCYFLLLPRISLADSFASLFTDKIHLFLAVTPAYK